MASHMLLRYGLATSLLVLIFQYIHEVYTQAGFFFKIQVRRTANNSKKCTCSSKKEVSSKVEYELWFRTFFGVGKTAVYVVQCVYSS